MRDFPDGDLLDLSIQEGARRHRSGQGKTAQMRGLMGECVVERHYRERGFHLLESRWRGRAGEIDLIFEKAGDIFFVEVKAARTFAWAAERLQPRQLHRIMRAAQEFLGRLPMGGMTCCQIDLALVNGTGEVEIVPNITMGL